MSELFKDFHAQLKGIANTNINIMEFVEDTLKPGMDKPLFLSQRVMLKAIYNLEFTPEEKALMDLWISTGKSNWKALPDGREYSEVILQCGQRMGKTFLSALVTAYELYRLVSMDNPQEYLDIPSTAPIFVTVMATTAEQGVNTIFGYLCGFLEGSAYFQGLKKANKMVITANDIVFKHKNIKVSLGHSNASAILGRTAIVVAFDELAFFSTDQGASSNAPEIYARIGRSTGNFGSKAKRITSSSVKEKGDFLETLVEDSWNNADMGTLVMNLTTFDGNPKMKKNETPMVIIDYRRDIEQAMRDYENIRPGILAGFMTQQLIKGALTLPDNMYVKSELYYHTDELGDMKRTLIRKNIIEVLDPNPEYEYICHCDPAVKNDTFAVVIGHKEYTPSGIKTVIDQILEWIPEKNEFGGRFEVDQENVYDTLLILNKYFKFKQITFDGWESHGLIQRLFRQGIPTFKHPFGRSIQLQMFKSLKNRMVSNLVDLPNNSSLYEELENLQISNGNKVNHPVNKPSKIQGKQKISKDIVDCIIVINWYIAEQEMQYDNNPDIIPKSKGVINTVGVSRTASFRAGSYQSRFTDLI